MLKQNVFYANRGTEIIEQLGQNSLRFPRRTAIALILIVALLAFELFNFDTTRYALTSLLGPVSFLGVGWASILAIAFCAIDFAGLVHLFTPESGGEQPKEVWYLMGAWLLGATMNALMTWWAVSLTLLNHEFGNEVLSRAQLLQIVPIFVATLVWLTRILFIGALTVTGSHLVFAAADEETSSRSSVRLSTPTGKPLTERALLQSNGMFRAIGRPNTLSSTDFPHVTDELPEFLSKRRQNRYERQGMEESLADVGVGQPSRDRTEPASTRMRGEEATRVTRPSTSDDDDRSARPHQRVRQSPPMPARANGHSTG